MKINAKMILIRLRLNTLSRFQRDCWDERQGEPRRSSLERRRVRLRRNSALIPRSLLRGASF